MSDVRLILASTSPWRAELLARFGLPFDCRSPEVDEALWKRRIQDAEELVRTLAELKARAVVRPDDRDVWIVGADQVALHGRDRLDKPGTVENAEVQLRRLSGSTHELHTGWFVLRVRDGAYRAGHDVHRLRMRRLSTEEIRAYVRRDSPLGCAGSYRLESLGVTLFEAVEGVDSTAVVGLPLMGLSSGLRALGFDVLREAP